MPKNSRAKKQSKIASVIAIGASAGGTKALKEFFAKVPSLEDTAIIVAQHLDVTGKHLVIETLKAFTKLKVVPLSDGARIAPGAIYAVPPHAQLTFHRHRVELTEAHTTAKKLSVVDHLFKSVAREFGTSAIGIVLSGDAEDGARGIKAIHQAGGLTIAQRPSTAQRRSMPEKAIASGVVDHVYAPGEIWPKIHPLIEAMGGERQAVNLAALKEQIASALTTICELLQRKTKHDFKHYKTSTLVRRILRRMQVLRLISVDRYIDHLEKTPDETEILFRELLINVTSFFRDPEAFEALRSEVLKPLLHSGAGQKIRIWVPGCSTGEEPYSIAILLRELLAEMDNPPEIQIIATDIDDAALNAARRGSFSLDIAEHVSNERLQKYFQKRAGKYHVVKELREMCLFSIHNLINDPPFSQLDLISCRNVLIYLGPHLQKKLFPVFHYALRQNGYLFLGTSETLTSHRELFKSINTKHRIAQRKVTAIKLPSINTSVQSYLSHFQENEKVTETDLALISQRIALDEMPFRYAVINDEGQILSSSAGIGKYVQIPEGAFQNNIVKLVTPSLKAPLRSAFNAARKEKRKVTNESCTIKVGDVLERTCIIVQPMPQLGDLSELYWIAFQSMGKFLPKDIERADLRSEAIDVELVEQLERELSLVRDDLDKSVQDLEASNEELKSSNEELLSMNEELQSANEELETSKEEVQNFNDALQRANSDLENLLASTQIATLFLDENFRIRGFTPAIKHLYNIQTIDIGRPLSDITTSGTQMPAFPAPQALHEDQAIEDDIRLANDRVFLRRVMPYLNPAREREGIVVTFIDISEVRRIEGRFFKLANSVPVITWTTDTSGNVEFFNARWYEYTGQTNEGAEGWGWQSVLHPEDLERTTMAWTQSLKTGSDYRIEYRLKRHDGAYRWHLGTGVAHRNEVGEITGWFGTCTDIDDEKQSVDAVRSSEQHFRTLVDNSPALMWITDKDAKCTYLSKQWYDTTGRTAEQDLGFGWVENVHPDDREAAGQAFFSAVNARGRISIRYRLRHKDGSYRWAVDSGLPLISDDKEFLGYIGTVIDIHDQVGFENKLIDLNQRFERSAAATDLGVWYCDLPFDELIWNREVKNHFFIKPNERVTIDDFYAHIVPEDREMTRSAIQKSIDSHGPYDILYHTFDPANPDARKLIRAIGWTDYDQNGMPIRFDGITLDVTAEHQAHEELRLAKSGAERAKLIAETANESKTRFLANMSHEIRTPLSAVIGFSELLKVRLSQDSEASTYIQRISRNSQLLGRLIDELLDLSKIEADKLEVENTVVDLESMIDDVFATLALKAEEKGIELVTEWATDRPEFIVTDRVRFSQILTNIIGNAVKFTERGSVRVQFRNLGSRLEIEVHDTGIGLTADQQSRIFEPFMQGDASVTRKYGGTGLGLALAKKLAVLLGGDLTLTASAVDKGSTFKIEIATNIDAIDKVQGSRQTPLFEPPTEKLKGKKLLVVDDSEDNRTLVNIVLANVGVSIDEASNGQEAVAMALEKQYDLILMDIQMPVLDGYGALDRLKALGVKTPVVALTAHAFKEEKDRCLKVGFATYITKPIHRPTLIEAISNLMS